MRHFKFMLWGYGGEAAYLALTKDQYEYWSKVRDDGEGDGEYEVIDYMTDPEEYVVKHTIPEGMDYMLHRSGSDTYYNSWYEAPNEFAHAWGGAIQGGMRITVQEVETDEYTSPMVKDGYELEMNLDEHEEKYNSVEYGQLLDYQGEPVVEPDYVCQFWSAEKGTFFETTITAEEFDPAKLKFVTQEYPNGDDVIIDVVYDGEIYSNDGGDTNGKGYSVHFWSNVNG